MSDSVTKFYENQERTGYPGDIKIVENKVSDKVWDVDYQGYIKSEKGATTDKYVQQVKEKFESRSQEGIKKYGTTLERNDLTNEQWIEHAIEEAMDFILYLTVLKDKIK